MRNFNLVVLSCFAIGCGGKSVTKTSTPPDMSSSDGGGVVGQHGVVVDYFQRTPLVGFTVTDGANSVTTDASGAFLLPAPMDVVLAPQISGPGYSSLYLPEAMAGGTDVDRGFIPIPSTMTFGLEQSLIKADSTMAVVQIIVEKMPTCASIAGGTVTVQSPAGAQVAYFNPQGLPTATAFMDVTGNRPAAVVYDVPPGEVPVITITHPSCTQMPASATIAGQIFDGKVITKAAEPGDFNSALVFALQ